MKQGRFIQPSILFFLLVNWVYPVVTKGPYLIQPGQNSMTIMWESDLSEEAVMWYGENLALDQILKISPLAEKNGFYLYRADLKNLESDHKYFYKIKMSDDVSALTYFHTSPMDDSPIDFIAVGDSRTGHDIHRSISDIVLDLDPDLVISMGDLVGTGGKFEEWGPHYFKPAARVMDHIPLISTLGDHDTGGDDGENFHYYLRPTEGPDRLWFSYDYGPAHFVSLDYRGADDQEMMAWFEKDMAASDAKWNFVYIHRPSYNLGGHRQNWGIDHWPALYRKYKVDIVFSGHSHMYERFYPMRPSNDPGGWPVTYITTGGAGAGLYDSVENGHLAVTRSVNHLVQVKLDGDTLNLVAYLPDNRLLDEFQMIKVNDQYDPDYLNLIKPQEQMDVYMVFASNLQIRFNEIPSPTNAAQKEILLESNSYDQDITFEIKLAERSAEHYRLEPMKGILKKGIPFKSIIKVFSKHPVTNKGRYFDPPLFFNAHYQTNSFIGIAKGRESRYYPPEKD